MQTTIQQAVVLLALVLLGDAEVADEVGEFSKDFEAPAAEPSSPQEIFYVIEPFESMVNPGWFSHVHNDDSYIELNVTTEDALFGENALHLKYMIKEGESSGGYVDFGVIEPERPHICQGATHLSLWYKVIQLGHSSGTRNTKLGFVLLDDSHCTKSGGKCGHSPGDDLENYYLFNDMLNGANSEVNDWQEIRIELSGSNDSTLRLSSSHSQGNRKLDLAHLRGWRIRILTDQNLLENASSSSSGTMLIDQLSCVGGGELFGAGFYSGNNWTDAVLYGGWEEEYYQSEISEEQTSVVMEDGVLDFNYTVQQVENWGGFEGFTYRAPGSAYYNLSHATHVKFGYHVTEPQSPAGRTHVRLILADASDCMDNCNADSTNELWYSFNYILDGGQGDNVLALVGSLKPETPFWLTGWSGNLGNEQLDTHTLKGYTIEFNVDSQGDENSTVSGRVTIKDVAAVFGYEEEPEDKLGRTDHCIIEPSLFFRVSSPVFKKVEFLGSQCCAVCEEDPTCLYAVSTGMDCYTASHLNAETIGLLNSVTLQEASFSLWMDNRRGEFCELCQCREEERTVDCRGRDLVIVPKTFTPVEEWSWSPRILDLRDNPKLVLLGSSSLSLFADTLEELWLPFNMSYLGVDSLQEMSALKAVHFEDREDGISGGNVIAEPNGIFGDVCCGLGYHFELPSPTWGLNFCDLKYETTGIDSVYFDFVQYLNSSPLRVILPSSTFMTDASDSAENCAEYCTISEECMFFSYDRRRKNAGHTCYLLFDNGTHAEEVCCEDDHYADDEGTTSGWISGYPPRTRHNLDGAKVLFPTEPVVAGPENEYKVQFEFSLGSTPLRGGVWIEPTLRTFNPNTNVSLWPNKVALYDVNTTAIINVEISVLDDSEFTPMTLVVDNIIHSCDKAFTSFSVESRRSAEVFIEVIPSEKIDRYNRNVLIAIAIPLALVLFVALGLSFIYYSYAQKRNDMMWKVQQSELIFDEPPAVIGQGSFGLVLLAEYRGTKVAVKFVLPPRDEKLASDLESSQSLSSRCSSISGEFLADGMVSEQDTGDLEMNNGVSSRYRKIDEDSSQSTNFENSVSSNERKASTILESITRSSVYRKRKKDFVNEMRHLSKLRHPCITTVMGAVVSPNVEPMLVMEYMDHGSLYDLVHNETMLMEGQILLQLLQDITKGVRFLHATNPQVIHGDLKAQNILVDSKLRAKVADFGLSRKKRMGATGTLFWIAPELLRGDSINTAASDVYSFGIILYEVYSRKEPYEGENIQEVLRDIADPAVNKRPPVPDNCPPQLASLMSDCIVANPEERPTFEELDKRLGRVEVEALELPGREAKTTISLFDIFPKHIAEALRDGKQVEPEHREIVTIFFSDIVGFTDISSTLSPRKVAVMLDQLYKKFDHLSHEHDIFKVETIGDAYMAVTNLVKDQAEDHVKRIADFAVDAIDAANSTLIDTEDPDRGCVNIRVGFHSGPVVADVVGSRNPRYCLFGDTVNTASRMESNSAKNRIHCSKIAAELLMEQNCKLPITPRGVITVKGKGEMFTYWVNEEASASVRVRSSSRRRMLSKKKSMPFLGNIHSLEDGNSLQERMPLPKGGSAHLPKDLTNKQKIRHSGQAMQKRTNSA